MTERSQKARDYFLQSYNCTQAVVLAYCDELGLDKSVALKFASSFGGGMGRLREVCGAISGIFMVAGMLYGYDDPKDKQAKAALYAKIQELAARSKAQNGSIVCRELLGLSEHKSDPTPDERTPAYYKKRPCPDLVAAAVQILDDFIAEQKNS